MIELRKWLIRKLVGRDAAMMNVNVVSNETWIAIMPEFEGRELIYDKRREEFLAKHGCYSNIMGREPEPEKRMPLSLLAATAKKER